MTYFVLIISGVFPTYPFLAPCNIDTFSWRFILSNMAFALLAGSPWTATAQACKDTKIWKKKIRAMT